VLHQKVLQKEQEDHGLQPSGVLDKDAQLLLDVFQTIARTGVEELVAKLTEKYEHALEELCHCRDLLKARQEMESNMVPLREENVALKRKLEQLRAATVAFPPWTTARSSPDDIELTGSLPMVTVVRTTASHRVNRIVELDQETIRLLVFLDPSPECDDECALLYILSECNNSHINAIVELVVPDSMIRFSWMAYLFRDKFAETGTWDLAEDGRSFTMGCVIVNFYFLPSSRKRAVNEDFKRKLYDKFDEMDLAGKDLKLNPRQAEEVPGGSLAFILLSASVPELDPAFFGRFDDVGAAYVVGTPGGVNCPMPSWSHTLFALHQLGPVVYLAPQFTREVRLPRSYVEENPHWTWYMKETVFDSALTVMARRPEIPADWGLILRLNAANAKVCRCWYQDVMGKPIENVENCPSRFKSIVAAYVDRYSGYDRNVGSVANELRLLGISTGASLNAGGEPRSKQDLALLRESYREELFKAVYTCVATTETLLFSNQENFVYTGDNGFPSLLPRCGYADPHESLNKTFGTADAVAMLRNLPVKSLTPAYDMVGAICALSFVKTKDFRDVGGILVKVEQAPASMSSGLFAQEADTSQHPIIMVGEQAPEAIDAIVNLLHLHVSTDPLLLIDDFWAKMKLQYRPHMTPDLGVRSIASVVLLARADGKAKDLHNDRPFMQRLVTHPSSKMHMVWAVVTLLLICYDCIVVPLSVFGLQEVTWMLWIIKSWWTMDIVHSFFVGYYSNGVVELRPRHVAMHYLKTWFVVDLAIVVSDWLLLVLSFNSQFVFLFKMGRVARMVRSLHFSQLDQALARIQDLVPGHGLDIFIRVSKMMFTILGANHFVACGWYYVGIWNGSEEDANTWIRAAELETASPAMLYFTSLHWAFAHMVLGEIDVFPKQVSERIYSIVILNIGLVVFSSFVSALSELMSRAALEQAESKRRDVEVQKYLEGHRVSALLTVQIDRYRKDSRRRQLRMQVPKADIEGLQLLPEGLAMKLSHEVFRRTMNSHVFFYIVESCHESAAVQFAHSVMQEQTITPGKDIFEKGEVAESAFITIRGTVRYTSDDFQEDVSEEYTWVSELALWLGGWKRRGQLETRTSVEMHVLGIQAFKEFARELPQIGRAACNFAESAAHLKVPFSELNDLQGGMVPVASDAHQAFGMEPEDDTIWESTMPDVMKHGLPWLQRGKSK